MIRALWDEFPHDRATHYIDDQFLWGAAFMVTPVIRPYQRRRKVYFPSYGQRWYDITYWLRGGHINEVKQLGWKTVAAPIDVIPLFVRGGTIFPTHASAGLNSDQTRMTGWHLLVALDKHQTAEGKLFIDDGEGIDTVQHGKYTLVNKNCN